MSRMEVRDRHRLARHTVLVMAALVICSITAALLCRTDSQVPAPVRPDHPPPADPGMIPLTVPETGRLLAHPAPSGAAGRTWYAAVRAAGISS